MAWSAEVKAAYAQKLRDNPTASEQIVFERLSKTRHKFCFQPVLFGYIPDFYFPDQQKIVELDGRCHDAIKDRKRDKQFRSLGIDTLRLKSSRVFSDLSKVMRSIDIFVWQLQVPKRQRKALQVKKIKKGWQLVPKLTKDHLLSKSGKRR